MVSNWLYLTMSSARKVESIRNVREKIGIGDLARTVTPYKEMKEKMNLYNFWRRKVARVN